MAGCKEKLTLYAEVRSDTMNSNDDAMGEFRVLSRDPMEEIFKRLTVAEAARQCATSSEFRAWCEKYDILERLAQKEIQERAPYSTWYGPALDLVKLIERGQRTMYEVRHFHGGEAEDESPPYSLEVSDKFDAMDYTVHLYLSLPGTILQRGRYWIFGSPDMWTGIHWFAFKTQDELRERLRFLRDMQSFKMDEATEFVEEFLKTRGLKSNDEFQQRVGPEDGDLVDLYMLPVIVDE